MNALNLHFTRKILLGHLTLLLTTALALALFDSSPAAARLYDPDPGSYDLS